MQQEDKALAINATALRKRLGGISKSGLAKLIADGKIRPLKAFNRFRLFAMADVEALLSNKK